MSPQAASADSAPAERARDRQRLDARVESRRVARGRRRDERGRLGCNAADRCAITCCSSSRARRLSPRDRALVELLIEALDDDGYLQPPLEELLAMCPAEAEVELDELRTALRLLQSFDPPGIGARDTAECLRLATRRARARLLTRPRDSTWPGAIVSEHLPLLAARDFLKLKKALGCTEDDAACSAPIDSHTARHVRV